MNDIPFIAVESLQARYDRIIKRLWVLVILLVVLLVGTNCAWLYYESQFETVQETTEQTVTQDNEGGDNTFIGGDGNVEADS